MKKIMKKVLSLTLALVMMLTLAPMTTKASELGALDNMDELTSGTTQITLEVGDTYYFAYTAPEYGAANYSIKVENASMFCQLYVYDSTMAAIQGADPINTYYAMGVNISAQAATSQVSNEICFAICNTYGAAVTCTVTIGKEVNNGPTEYPEGSYENPKVVNPMEGMFGAPQTVEYTGEDYWYKWESIGDYRYTLTFEEDDDQWYVSYVVYESAEEDADVVSEGVVSHYGTQSNVAEIDVYEGNVIMFGISTMSGESADIVFTMLPYDLGTETAPANLKVGENVVENVGGYYYKWVAEIPGSITLTPGTDSGITCILNDETLGDATQEVTLDVEKDDELLVIVWGNSQFVSVTAEYLPDYDGVMEDYVTTYEYKGADLKVGTNNVTLNTKADCTVFDFVSDTTGYYKFVVTGDAVVDSCGASYYLYPSGNETNTYVLEYGWADESVCIGVFSDSKTATVTVTYEGEIVEPTYTVYKNTVTPEEFTFEGNVNNLSYVYVADGKEDIAVKDDKGVYHLGSVNGPVLYVQLGENPMESSVNLGYFAEVYMLTVVDALGNYTYYDTAVQEYVACADEKTGLYPLTDDLKKVLVEYGNVNGWYNMDDPMGTYLFKDAKGNVLPCNEDTAWMFACCYEAAVNTTTTETKWVEGSKDGLKIVFNAEYRDFIELMINGKLVDEEYYTVTEGSTIITLSKEYLSTLAKGDYKVSAVFMGAGDEDFVLDAQFTVEEYTPVEAPKTGDATNFALWIALLGLGAVAIAGSVVMKKREF